MDSLHDSPKVLGVEFKMSRGICFCSLNLTDPPTVLEIGPKLMIRMVHTHVLNGICYHINCCRMLSNLFCNCCFTSQGEEKTQKSEESVQRSVEASIFRQQAYPKA